MVECCNLSQCSYGIACALALVQPQIVIDGKVENVFLIKMLNAQQPTVLCTLDGDLKSLVNLDWCLAPYFNQALPLSPLAPLAWKRC